MSGSEGTRVRALPTRGPNTLKVRKSISCKTCDEVTTVTQVGWNALRPNWHGTQKTVSSSHKFRSRKASDTGDLGGPFFSQRKYVSTNINMYTLTGQTEGSGGWPKTMDTYHGHLLPAGIPTSNVFPPVSNSTELALKAWGTKAIAACKPTNQVADVSTFILELAREGIPELVSDFWRTGAINAKTASDQHLNFEFGWRPIADDIGSFLYDVTRADTVIKQWKRDAGRNVRRQHRFPIEMSESITLMDQNNVPNVGSPSGLFIPGAPATGKTYRTRKTVRRRWFSGAFTYPYPKDDESLGMLEGYADAVRKADMTLGLTPSLDTIWQLSPWTWAVDWFSSAGDVVSNLQSWADDGLVLRYGYIMEHSIISDTYTYVGPTNLQSGALPDIVTFVTETKMRQKATPFGFGLTWSGLSPRQLAIAASLGITKS
jgi:hypothetical protein